MSSLPTTEAAPVAPIANSADEWRDEMARLSQSAVPSFFKIRARLPIEGRTNQVLGASRHMNVVLKTYASGGENECTLIRTRIMSLSSCKAVPCFTARGEKRGVW